MMCTTMGFYCNYEDIASPLKTNQSETEVIYDNPAKRRGQMSRTSAVWTFTTAKRGHHQEKKKSVRKEAGSKSTF